MDINTLQRDEGGSIYYTEDFLHHIYGYRRHLLNNAIVFSILAQYCYKYENDFYGLLDELNVTVTPIPRHFYPTILLLNGYTSPSDFTGKKQMLFIPDFTTVEQLGRLCSSMPTPI